MFKWSSRRYIFKSNWFETQLLKLLSFDILHFDLRHLPRFSAPIMETKPTIKPTRTKKKEKKKKKNQTWLIKIYVYLVFLFLSKLHKKTSFLSLLFKIKQSSNVLCKCWKLVINKLRMQVVPRHHTEQQFIEYYVLKLKKNSSIPIHAMELKPKQIIL